nr:immunoglobulin heavy chain junction region [Mus musculus]MBK4185597.1 immunoglobulin heavy chain junction region [Mus musculus]
CARGPHYYGSSSFAYW